jgi:hypothetical protein
LAKYHGLDTVYQVGDFGLWDHTEKGVLWLDSLNGDAEKYGVDWYFVAGNHENYDSLEQHAIAGTMDNGMVYIREHITWVGRSNVWYHDDLLMGAVGGAVSIDRHARTPGVSWWPQEMTTYGDVQRFADQILALPREDYEPIPHVDVLLTHDAPMTLPDWEGFIKDDELSNANRKLMTEVGTIAGAGVWFHGHYHKELEYNFDNTRVYGLDCNIRYRWAGCNAAIYDNGTIKLLEID